MNEKQKELLAAYLDQDITILAISFLKAGNISSDTLTVHYNRKDGSQWKLITDRVLGNGEVISSSVKVNAPG